jgi:spermidine synthase
MPTIAANSAREIKPASKALSFYYPLFLLSGFPALLYQIVWQRALFTLYGVNVESVTMIVTVFMLGLGLGSLAGGWLSSIRKVHPEVAFGIIEISIGIFGYMSLWIFHRVGLLTAGHSTFFTGIIAFTLLLLPTLLMGSTLPLLVEYAVRTTGNVGESVGSLYSVNTFGSAVGCFAAAIVLMGALGESGVIHLACSLNLLVGASALTLSMRSAQPYAPHRRESAQAGRPRDGVRATIPLWIGASLAGITGFIALAYEIVWYRVYSFASGGTASTFALLLGFYLLGIAIGSCVVQEACKRKLGHDLPNTLWVTSVVILLGSVSSFLLGPAVARSLLHFPLDFAFFFVAITAAFLGSAFPLLAHSTIVSTGHVGKGASYLYLSNIVGSAVGSFLVGFVILNYWSTRATSTLLLLLGLGVFLVLAFLSRLPGKQFTIALSCLACMVLVLASGRLYAGMYERLLAKTSYTSGMRFGDFIENRSGEIAVLQDGTVYGGGIYDGRFNTDPIVDTNGIFRAYAIAGMHPHPTRVLIIGLSSGSWAQVVANNFAVKDITIVEINPGYLPLIEKHSQVRSLLHNPKVHIVIDDGRRWLFGHPDQKFDFILMNTTYSWRANASNLLSREFLTLIRSHLKPDGIDYYNTTWSEEAMATGISVFPYSLRIANFLAVSDYPFTLDKARWRDVLARYSIDGHLVFDLANPIHQRSMEQILAVADESSDPHGNNESKAHMKTRLNNVRIVTDDNMGTEWH